MRGAAVVGLLLAVPPPAALADAQPQCTHAIVAPQDWTYAAMRSVTTELRPRGLSPLRFSGDFAYSALEMSRMAWVAYECATERESVPDSVLRWLGALLREFEWELEADGKPVAEALARIDGLWERGAQGYGSAAVGVVADARGPRPEALGTVGVARFSHKPSAWAVAELAHRPPDAAQDRLGRPAITRAAAYWRKPDYRLSAGRDFLRMGPGVRGGFTYGGDADPYGYVRYRDRVQALGTRIALDVVLSGFVHGGGQAYSLTRRMEKRLSPELELAVGDTSRVRAMPNLWYWALPAPYASIIQQRTLGRLQTWERDNIIMHGELYWQASPWVEVYFDGGLDELELATLLENLGIRRLLRSLFGWLGAFPNEPGYTETQNGYLLGLYLPDALGNDRMTLRMEMARTTRRFGISTHSESLDLFYGGRPLQHRIGPDASGLYVEANYWMGQRNALKLYADWVERGRSLPVREQESLVGAVWLRELGRDTALRLALTHREVRNELNVRGATRRSTACSASLQWWF